MSNVATLEKFTPAPWTSEYDDNGFFYVGAENMPSPYIAATGGEGIADQANAKLIAAAPELLEACQEMIKHITETDFDVCGTPDELLNKWKAAIKKATT